MDFASGSEARKHIETVDNCNRKLYVTSRHAAAKFRRAKFSERARPFLVACPFRDRRPKIERSGLIYCHRDIRRHKHDDIRRMLEINAYCIYTFTSPRAKCDFARVTIETHVNGVHSAITGKCNPTVRLVYSSVIRDVNVPL